MASFVSDSSRYLTGVPRRPDPELRPRLLDAAIRIFADSGYAAATIDAVGRAAGVTKGGVYFHFEGKEELFFAALDDRKDRLRSALDSASASLGEGATANRWLEARMAAWFGFHFEDPPAARLLRLLVDEARGGWTGKLRQDARVELRDRRSAIKGAIVRGLEDGSLFATDPAASAFLIASQMDGIVDHWLRCAEDVRQFCAPRVLAGQVIMPWRTERPVDEDVGPVGDMPTWLPWV